MTKSFFPPRPDIFPKIYAYEDTNPQYAGLLKVGFTTKKVIDRVREQYPTLKPGKPPYNIVLEMSAVRNDGSAFTDHDVHNALKKHNISNPEGEWFKCSVKDIESAVLEIKTGKFIENNRNLDFKMRPEQQNAVTKAIQYYKSFIKEIPEKTPHFLWNAKMRFGKTFATYQLAMKMKWTKVLVLTFKPAVQSAWEEDIKSHIDFKDWQFLSRNGLSYDEINIKKPFVCFASFQDFLGKNDIGGIKLKNEWAHAINWDCVVFDEYHFGAWRENAKELFEAEGESESEFGAGHGIDNIDEEIIPITTSHYLYLSGTPFRAIASGEFIEEQIFNWTYSDEQKAKEEWQGENNPYLPLPRMVMMTYQLPDNIREVAIQGEFNEFDLNIFFKAEGSGKNAAFTYKNEVQKWLDLIRGSLQETTIDNLKMGAKKPPLPFADSRLLGLLLHTFWFLPTVSSCQAMKNLLTEKQNLFFYEYKVIVSAGKSAGVGVDALPPVFEAMENPLTSKTITLSCGKLTTGVSVKPWTGIFMLRNSSSPETYFQAAFRVQTPWTIKNPDGLSPNKEEIIKKECYIFDFAPDRALRQIADYSCRLNVNEGTPEAKVAEFIHFLPVLCYDGSSMKEIDPAGVLDIAMSGTSATLLARRWESALLVNVDNATLLRLMNNPDAMRALMSIEGFRSLNQDIETIINKSEVLNKTKKETGDKEVSQTKKKEISDEEIEIKNKRKQIQEKLIKFATRIPVFMYLTDYRERTLKDVITKLEPGLFKKVTGIDIKDFELLVSLNVFNSALMNDAVYKFKRYEDASLSYTGINSHKNEDVGLYDTVLSKQEFNTVLEGV